MNAANLLIIFCIYLFLTGIIFSLHFDKTKLSLEAFFITWLFQTFNSGIVKHTTSKSVGILIYCHHQSDPAICSHSNEYWMLVES